MNTSVNANNNDNEKEDKDSEDYWSFLQEYNFRDQPYKPLLWEYGDRDGEFQWVENPTFGYWEDYYDDLEAGFIDRYLIYEVRILSESMCYQNFKEVEDNMLKQIAFNIFIS
jgi:hypothetical protein